MIKALIAWWESLFPEPVITMRTRPFVITSPCLFTRLGLPLEASQSEIEGAYKAAKKKCKDAHQRQLVDEAYHMLRDPDKREILLLVRYGMAKYFGVAPSAVTKQNATIVYDAGPFRITRRT